MMFLIPLFLLLGCDLLESLKGEPSADTADEPLSSGSVYSSMPYASEASRRDWNCDFLTGMDTTGGTGLEEYGVVAVYVQGVANLYASTGDPDWVYASMAVGMHPEIIDGEILYNGLYYPMGHDAVPGYLTAAVTNGPVDMAVCRGYLWVE